MAKDTIPYFFILLLAFSVHKNRNFFKIYVPSESIAFCISSSTKKKKKKYNLINCIAFLMISSKSLLQSGLNANFANYT